MRRARVGILTTDHALAVLFPLLLEDAGLTGVPCLLPAATAWPDALRFVTQERLRVALVVLGYPYRASWASLLTLCQLLPSVRFLTVTLHRTALDAAVGPTDALGFDGNIHGPATRQLLAALHRAAHDGAAEPDGAPAAVS